MSACYHTLTWIVSCNRSRTSSMYCGLIELDQNIEKETMSIDRKSLLHLRYLRSPIRKAYIRWAKESNGQALFVGHC